MSAEKENQLLELRRAAEVCGLRPEVIERFIAFAWIQPCNQDELLLDESDLSRSRLIWQLQEDLGVNDAGVDVILELVDQLHLLHSVLGELRKKGI